MEAIPMFAAIAVMGGILVVIIGLFTAPPLAIVGVVSMVCGIAYLKSLRHG